MENEQNYAEVNISFFNSSNHKNCHNTNYIVAVNMIKCLNIKNILYTYIFTKVL